MDVTATQLYFTDVDVSVEGVDMFIASQIVQSPSFGEITKEGFVKGWAELQ
jgi:DCN1-like protein 1/2